MKILGIIPARYASSRLMGKPLAKIGDLTMIQRVYNQVKQAKYIEKVVVATDDERILEHVHSFGGEAMMTSENHQSGTDRCAEVARSLKDDFDIVINIQGDEPFIQPEQVDSLAEFMVNNDFEIGTLAKLLTSTVDLFNPNTVKVIFAYRKAIYFSRHPIPYIRDFENENWIYQYNFHKHIGMYAYRMKTLLKLTELMTSKLEFAESLEQLRWLENGYSIGVQTTKLETFGIDTPEDLIKGEAFLNK
jgi:3-deoxy-manno-octulosonate cytidylyltransferase (CMP-KDO synthetase)